MRVVSYNIRKAVGLDWRRDPDRILDVLAEIDADVVVLQEADKRAGPREGVLPLERMETELGYALPDVSVRPLSHGWHGNAIFLRQSLVQSGCSRIDLPSVEPRGSVSVTLGQPEIEVVGVHLGLTPGMRRRQMAALQEVIASRSHPVLLAGDFNEWNGRRLQFGGGARVVTPGLSFHAARPVAALDRFVLGPGLGLRRSWVHHSQQAARASDHLPIVADIVVMEAKDA